MKHEYRFVIASHGGWFEDSYKANSDWGEDDLDYVVQDCAEYYHGECDGWESHWPLEIIVWDTNGIFLGLFFVEREYDPVFSATEIVPPKNRKLTGTTNNTTKADTAVGVTSPLGA